MGENNTNICETHTVGRLTRERIVTPQACPLLARHGIILAGVTEAGEGFQFTRSEPGFAQILACLEGMGEVLVEGEWRTCATGMTYVTPADVHHAYRSVRETDWRLCWVMYQPQNLSHALAGLSGVTLIADVDAGALASAIDGLYREGMGGADPAAMQPWAELIHFYAQGLLHPQPSLDPRLRRLWEQVDADLAAPWTIETLAQKTRLSGEHLRRLCRLHLHESPMRYLTMLRMRRAAAVLTTEGDTVESVAQQVGYENAFAFSAAFKRCLGLSPSQYRSRARSGGG